MQATRRERKHIDWQELRNRLAQARAALDEAFEPSPERAHRIMAERARDLARLAATPRAGGRRIEVLAFRTQDRRYAIETAYVREIARPAQLIPVPTLPPFMRGLIPWRGEMVLAVDLAPLLGIAQHGITDLMRLVVLGRDAPEFALLVEAVDDIVPLREDELQPVHATGPQPHGGGLVRALAPSGLTILDGRRLLDDPRLFVDQGPRPATTAANAHPVPDESTDA